MTRCPYCERPAALIARAAYWAINRRWWFPMPRTHAVLVDLQRNVCLVCRGTNRRRR